MKTWLLACCFALLGACAARVPGDEAPDFGEQVAATQVEGSSHELQSTGSSPSSDAAQLSLDTNDDSVDALGKNKCTPARQYACDACVDACDYLCDRPNGGGPTGTCIGLFCPTRCEACVLSCYKTCGKCTPSGF